MDKAEKIKQARRWYHKEWRKNNQERHKENNNRFWLRKYEEMKTNK